MGVLIHGDGSFTGQGVVYETLVFISVEIWSLQVYYELHEERKKSDRKDVAICRVEQLCPFPYDLIQRELKRYPSMGSSV
ncbi:hypothetical protein BHM03_00021649 [Ensete ventricosum]|nr:hypothetical protein BHM03_00021649 [Ensete ventricosum]